MKTKKTPTYFDQVYRVTELIPFGRVTNYGAIADFLALGSARMVGWALNKCGHTGIPAHRVVNRKGELSGRNQFPTPTMMEELLKSEGVEIVNNKVKNFEVLFWHPGDHLDQESFDDEY
ncbi:MAG: MGMT family protein [Bacteroidia bacterium]|nr:MGMT family protein [Bacteroidia bacterium]